MKYIVLSLAVGLCSCAGNGAKSGKSESAPLAVTAESVPSRQAEAGFRWEKVSGGGLCFWAQRNDDIRVMVDASLPGAVIVRNGDEVPHRVMQLFELKNKNINDVFDVLSRQPGWNADETGKMREVKSGREGVRRYVMEPDGDYALRIKKEMADSPVPFTCSGWGIGNSGMRYFEVFDEAPGKALFVEIGQDAPLFDEKGIRLTEEKDAPFSTDVLTVQEGVLCLGHEVRSFKPAGSEEDYWIVDKTGKLEAAYDRLTGGVKNGKLIKAKLKLEYNGKWDDGFAADYPGVYFVREVITLEK